MFFANLLPLELPIMETFIKNKVREIVSVFLKDPEHIPKEEVPYFVRYFLQFPSQDDVVNEMLPAIEKLEICPTVFDHLQTIAFEKYLINALKTNLYPDNDKEILIEAFRVLDIEKEGYIDLHTFYSFIKSYGISFKADQILEMEKFLVENETDFLSPMKVNSDTQTKYKQNQYTTRKFYYEGYVRKVVQDNKKHYDQLITEYNQFKLSYS